MNSWWIDDIVIGQLETGLTYKGPNICFWDQRLIISQMGNDIIKITVLYDGDTVHNATSGKVYTVGVH